MNSFLKLYKKPCLVILDLILINISLIASLYIKFTEQWINYLSYLDLLMISIIGIGVLYLLDLYNKMWRYASIQELRTIIRATILINLLFFFSNICFKNIFPESVIILNVLTNLILLGGYRFFLRILKNYLRNQITTTADHKVLIVGAGDAGEIILREINKHPELKKEVIGFVDDDQDKIGFKIHNKEVIGNCLEIPLLIKKFNIDEVIIAIPSVRGREIEKIFNLSKQEGVKINIAPGLNEIIKGSFTLNQVREVRVEDLLGREQVDLNKEEISSYIEGKNVIVTGGGGSIGSELCRQIVKFNPEKLIIFDLNENATYFLELELKKLNLDVEIISIIGSIQDRSKLSHVFARYKPQVVFHAAAHKHVPLMEHNPEQAVKNNIFGTKNLAEAADEFNVESFVLISTDKAVNPTNVMGATKRTAEMIIQSINAKSKTKFMAVRFGNVLGSNGSVIPIFKKQIEKGENITVTHEEITRYFMIIPEAAQLVIQAGALGKGGEVFVLDMDNPVKIIDLAKDLIKLSGLELGRDIDIEVVGLRPGEKLYEELLHDTESDISTEHERIFISGLETVEPKFLYSYLDKLERVIEFSDSLPIIKALVELVGTYKPNRDNVKSG